MKKIVILLCIATMLLCSCGNRDLIGIGSYTFNHLHIDSPHFAGCLPIEKWIEVDRGIEVKIEGYGWMFFSEGTYILVEDKCPICEAN